MGKQGKLVPISLKSLLRRSAPSPEGTQNSSVAARLKIAEKTKKRSLEK